MSILKNSIQSFVWNLLGSALLFVFQFWVAKYLGASLYGEANYYLGYVNSIMLFTNFGMQIYLPQKLSSIVNKKKFFSQIFFTISLVYTLTIPVVIGLLYNNTSMVFIILVIILGYLGLNIELLTSFYIGSGNTQRGMFIKRVVVSLVQIVAFLALTLIDTSKNLVYLYSILVSYLVICIPMWHSSLSKPEVNFKIIKEALSFYFVQLSYALYTYLSKILQGSNGDFGSVGVLSLALTLGLAINLFGDSFAKVAMPEFSKAWKDKNLPLLESSYKYITRINAYFVLPLAVAAIINSEKILSLLGKGYEGGSVIFGLIIFSQFVNSFVGPNGTLLNMTGNEKYEILNGVIKFVSGLSFGLLLGSRYSWGIAFSIALSEILINIIKTFQVKKVFNIIPYSLKDFTFLTVIGVISIYIFNYASKISNILIWFIVNGVIVLVLYLVLFYFSPNIEDKNFINKLKKKFTKASENK